VAILTRFDKIINLCQADESFVYLDENTETRDSSMCSVSEELEKLNSSEELEAYLKLIMKRDWGLFCPFCTRSKAFSKISNRQCQNINTFFFVCCNRKSQTFSPYDSEDETPLFKTLVPLFGNIFWYKSVLS
jgi:hypothetical protein